MVQAVAAVQVEQGPWRVNNIVILRTVSSTLRDKGIGKQIHRKADPPIPTDYTDYFYAWTETKSLTRF